MFIILIFLLTSVGADTGARPDIDEVPKFARWLVSHGKWGILTTVQAMEPFGYVASYSDAGIDYPYFYLSSLDPVGRNAQFFPQVCFTVTELAIDDCGGADAQSPTCPKISLTGQLRLLRENSDEEAMAEAALFSAHPAFMRFPKLNDTFAVYKPDINKIFLVNKVRHRGS